MQHLDEGTIHAWLDGALTPEEAALADAHVKDCPQCQAAVAEARGFIAASSRILTALDDVPRGVIPIAPKQRVQPWVWRVAATVLVVATGTVLLVKERGGESRSAMSHAADSAKLFKTPTMEPAVTTLSRESAADSAVGTRATTQSVPAPSRATAKPRLSAGNVETRATADAPRVDAGTALQSDAVRPMAAARAPAAAPVLTPLRQTFGAVAGAAAEAIPREVGSKRLLGRSQTFYEIAPGDTVVLEEQLSPHLESVVVTGALSGRSDQAQPARRAETGAASVEAQQKAAPAPPSAPPAAIQNAQVGGGRHSISWLDPSTRQVLILSGRHSQEELERIREQIQQLRAAQPKKNPE